MDGEGMKNVKIEAGVMLRDEELRKVSGGEGNPFNTFKLVMVHCNDCNIDFQVPSSLLVAGRKVRCYKCHNNNTRVV